MEAVASKTIVKREMSKNQTIIRDSQAVLDCYLSNRSHVEFG